VDVAVVDPLLAPAELVELGVELLLAGEDALLDLEDLAAPLLRLGLDLGADLDGLLARLDLRLAAEGVGLVRWAALRRAVR
jgi:hypothetical protein